MMECVNPSCTVVSIPVKVKNKKQKCSLCNSLLEQVEHLAPQKELTEIYIECKWTEHEQLLRHLSALPTLKTIAITPVTIKSSGVRSNADIEVALFRLELMTEKEYADAIQEQEENK